MSQCDIDNLHLVLRWIQQNEHLIKVTVTGDHIFIYANDLELIHQAANLPGVNLANVMQVTLRGQPGAINVRSSDYQYRTYFRCCSITAEQKQRLRDVLSHQTDIRVGAGLARWLQDTNLHVREYFFIDHNMPSLLTLLELAIGRLIRTTLPIVTDK